MRNKKLMFLCIGMTFFTVANYLLSADKSFKARGGLFMSNIEALAFDEYESGRQQKTQRHDCSLVHHVITGYDSNGRPIINQIHVDGAQGDCTGKPGLCDPWPCTEEQVTD